MKEGKIAFGCISHIPSTALIEIMGLAGHDFVMIDTEHGLYTIDSAGELIRTAQGVNLTPVVRVAVNDSTLISRALDLGAQGIIVPHVSTKDDAAKAVKASKYGPAGRGACPLIRANKYGLDDWAGYEERANAETLVFPLIEDLEGADNIEDIVSVEGINGIYLGPFDMSVSAGYKGDVKHTEIHRALDRILAACREKAMPVMHSRYDVQDIEKWVKKGVRLFLQTGDSLTFARACRQFLDLVSPFRNRVII